MPEESYTEKEQGPNQLQKSVKV